MVSLNRDDILCKEALYFISSWKTILYAVVLNYNQAYIRDTKNPFSLNEWAAHNPVNSSLDEVRPEFN